MKNACIVGYGAIAPSHVEAIKNTSCANLYGICDNNQNHLGKSHVTKAHQYYSDFNEMLKDQSVDVVHICAPHYLHKKMAICAMQAGKDVVLEKPAAISLKELEELISVKDSTHRHICYVLQNRTNKCIIKLKAIVDTHKYGKIIGVFGSLTWNRSAKYYTSSEWKGSFQREGGSLLINQAIHLVDMISYICGGIRSVQGSLSVTKLKNVIETEDTATLLLYLNNDVNGCVFATNTYACDEPYRIEIRFEEKTLYYMNGCLYALEGSVLELLETDDDKSKSGKKCWGSGHAKVINQFYDFLENQEGHYISLDDGVNSLKAVLDVYGKTSIYISPEIVV